MIELAHVDRLLDRLAMKLPDGPQKFAATPRNSAVAPAPRRRYLWGTHRIKRLPVLRNDKVIGIVSRANLMRALASVHRGTRKGSTNDAAIRERILREIEQQSWSAGAEIDVVVRAGVADIWGTIADPEQRTALKVLVANVPGAVASPMRSPCAA